MTQPNQIYQIIDANLNRSREGVRVVEEAFRFIKKDQKFNDALKDLRHEIFKAGQKLNGGLEKIKKSRDVNGDLGKDSFTDSEKEKKDISELIAANWQRVQESLRVLEEYSKLVDSKASFRFKKLRFLAYQLEKEMIQAL